MDEIPNDITKKTPASFEPTIDYVVTKIPKWAFEKFPGAEDVLGTQMKSVGEVMAIGRTFKESLFKGLRSLEAVKPLRLEGIPDHELQRKLARPNSNRFSYLTYALRNGYSIEEIHRLTKIDPWFLEQLQEVMQLQIEIENLSNFRLLSKSNVEIAEVAGNEFNGDRKAAFDWAVNNWKGKNFKNKDTGFDVHISRRSLEKALGESAIKDKSLRKLHYESVRVLDKLLQTAILAESYDDRNNDPNIKQIHRFYAALGSGVNLYQMKITVKEFVSEPDRFYTYEVSEIEMLNVIWTAGFSENEVITAARQAFQLEIY